jgi:integrase
MSIYKRGKMYWYKFMWNGEMVRESTRQTNQNTARQMEAAHRASLAKGEVGIRDRKTAQTLADFISERFEPWAEASTSEKTWLDYYRPGIRTIQAYKPMANLRLNEITSEKAADFAAWRQSAGLQVSSVNSSLQVLRRVMRLAAQWGAIEVAPPIKMLPGERHREHVVKPDEEARYLAAAPEPLGSVAAVLTDTGMRPDECYRSRWESVTWTNGRNGTILVTHGKTAAARRVLPLSARARNILQARWENTGRPSEGWVWSAPTLSGHFEKSTLKKQHKKALRLSRVRPFCSLQLASHVLNAIGGVRL